jgi:hypothetical protein
MGKNRPMAAKIRSRNRNLLRLSEQSLEIVFFKEASRNFKIILLFHKAA